MNKILLCEFHQESNSFNPVASTRVDYAKHGILTDGQLLDPGRGRSTLLDGIIAGLKESDVEIVPSCAMLSNSGGPVEQMVVDEFVNKTCSVIRANMPFDGACVSLHGATQSTEMEDVCGYILKTLRAELGKTAVITAGFDLHANITAEIRDNADYVCGYQTYPHVDFYETGMRVSRLCMEKLKGRALALAYACAPMIASANTYTTMHGPFGELMQYGKNLIEEGRIIDFSIFQTQPWLDVACNSGAEVVIIAEDGQTAKEYAKEMITSLWKMREHFLVNLSQVEEVIRIAQVNHSGKPVLLIDSADSANAGACGDSAYVMHKILETGSQVKAAFQLVDTQAVEKAMKLGVGALAQFTIGATKCSGPLEPITIKALVRSLHDGEFLNEGPALARQSSSVGKAAVLSSGNVDILVTSSVSQPGDPQFFRHFGIEPLFYQMLVVKACTSFRAAFENIAKEIFYTDTPGAASTNLNSLPFERVNKSFFPFDTDARYVPAAFLR